MNFFYLCVIIIRIGLNDTAGGLFFRLGNVFSIKMRGKRNDVPVSAFMVHFAFPDNKIRVYVRNSPVLYGFDKRTYRAVAASADQNQFRASAHIGACVFVAVVNDACSGRFNPAAKTADTVTDVGLGAYDFMRSLHREMKICDIGDD